MALIGGEFFIGVVEVKGGIRAALIQHHTHIIPCEHTGRDGVVLLQARGTSKPSEAGGVWTRLPPPNPLKVQPLQDLDLRLLAPESALAAGASQSHKVLAGTNPVTCMATPEHSALPSELEDACVPPARYLLACVAWGRTSMSHTATLLCYVLPRSATLTCRRPSDAHIEPAFIHQGFSLSGTSKARP